MNVSDVINGFVGGGLTVYIAYLFFASFSPLKRTRKSIFCLIPISILLSISMTFFRGTAINMLVTILLTLCISCLFRVKWYNHLLMTVSYIAISSVCEYIVGILISIIFSIDLQTGQAGIFYSVGLLFSKFLVLIIIILIRVKKHKLLTSTYRKQFGLILIIPITTIALLMLHTKYFVMIPENNYIMLGIALVCYTALIISNILVFDIIDNLCVIIIQDSKLVTVEELIIQQSKQYDQFIEHTHEIQKIRHDYQNFLLGLSAEIQNNHIDKALGIIQQEYNSVTGLTLPHQVESGNHTIDAFIAAKQQLAMQNDVKLISTYNISQSINISMVDFAIILGNALDNAIEASAKIANSDDRIVSVSISVKNKSLIISIINPVAHDVDINHLITTKQQSNLHGFGILSMKNVASKYHGDIAFQCENKIFTTHILLMNSPCSEKDNHTNSAHE